MPQVTVYNFDGQAVGSRELPAEIFGRPVNAAVLHQAVVAQAANARPVVAHTKTRGEVRGGGRKPWRQKGTGRARHGSIRSPLWIGGGVTFGPRPDRKFRRKINHRARRLALLSSLSAKVADAALVVVDDLDRVDRKTKQAAMLLQNLSLRPKKSGTSQPTASALPSTTPSPAARSARRSPLFSVLVVLPPEAKSTVVAFRNLPRVSVLSTDSLNVTDILAHRYLVVPVAGVDRITAVYGPKIPVASGRRIQAEPPAAIPAKTAAAAT